jgi:hypothetical protein
MPKFFSYFRLPVICVALCVSASTHAETLPLAPELINLASDGGERLLLESEAHRPYLPLSIHFVTQKNQAYCGVASTVMVLNALDVAAPAAPEYEPYHLFTQENVLNQKTEKILQQAVVAKQGMTLDQLGAFIGSYGVEATVRHASDTNVENFRRDASSYLSKPNHHVLVNYLRKVLGQERGGHISPLAAYDAKADRFLIMDVSRYKYPPVWVKTEQLFAAMNTPDSDNDNRSRGFVLVRRAPKD